MEAPPLALLSINAETAGSLKMRVSYTWRSICITESIVVASRAKKGVNFLNLIVYVWFCTHTFIVDDKYRACSHDKWCRKYYVCIPASSVAPPITPPPSQLLPPPYITVACHCSGHLDPLPVPSISVNPPNWTTHALFHSSSTGNDKNSIFGGKTNYVICGI